MTLWALRVAILGKGPWLVIQSEENLARLCNSARRRPLISDDLNRGIQEFSQLPLFERLCLQSELPPFLR